MKTKKAVQAQLETLRKATLALHDAIECALDLRLSFTARATLLKGQFQAEAILAGEPDPYRYCEPENHELPIKQSISQVKR